MDFPAVVLCKVGQQPLVPDVLRQSSGSGGGGGHEHDLILFPAPVLQVFDELVKAVVIRINGFGLNVDGYRRFEKGILLYHTGEEDRRTFQEMKDHFLAAVHKIGLRRQYISAFQAALHGQGKLLLAGPPFFLHPVRLVDEDHRVLRQIIEERGRFLIKIRQ